MDKIQISHSKWLEARKCLCWARVRIFSGAGLDVQWSGGSFLGVQWSGHVRRGFGGADDVAKRLIANWQKRAKQDDDVINHQLHGVAS